MCLTLLISSIIQLSYSGWTTDNSITTVIVVILCISYLFYGASLCPIAFMYSLEVLPERGLSLVLGQYWLSMEMTNISLSYIDANHNELLEDFYKWYLLFSSDRKSVV